ncbi:hypothetical protein BC830DRAFT_629795 [Chytriomyces sp. MP71]|nr:hypothetical protein BC830DRAFT_629795 [Chytriomyces sp. MP71]
MLGSVDLVHNIQKQYQYVSSVVTSSAVYKFMYQITHSTRIQIYFSSFFHTLDLTVMVMILVFSNGFELPSISYYNLIHAVLGSLGKISLVAGTYASALIGKEYVAKALVKKGRGIPLSDVAVSKNNFLPAEGLTVRHMFIGSLFLLEAATWYFVLEMQFIPIPTSLGFKPCIPATYTSPPNFLTDVPQFLSGDASMGVVYNYGLPLADGLIGGWAAWPLDNPSSQFDVRGDGVVYTYSVTCGNLQVAPKMRNVSELTMSMSYANLWTNSYTAIISVQFPAGAHSWAQHHNQSVTQSCTMQYVLGSGSVKFTFFADEWNMVTGGQMDQIDISGYSLTQYMDAQVYFDDVVGRIGSTTMHVDMVGWFVMAFTSCFNGTIYPPTQAGKISQLFQWSAIDGIYDVNKTWIGISGAVGSIAHYITMQYNGSASTDCEYFGQQGSGTLAVPPLNRSIMLAAVIIGFVCQMMQLLRWALTSGGGPLTDRVAIILNSPLLMLYYMRASITTLIPDIKDQNHSTRSIKNHMSKILVRIGEDKRTRGGKYLFSKLEGRVTHMRSQTKNWSAP